MAIRDVVWISKNALPCACQGTAKVIICTAFQATVPGLLTGTIRAAKCEGSSNYKHNLQYDDGDLPDGYTLLATTDIIGVLCEGCVTFWVREQFLSTVEYDQTTSFGDLDTVDILADADGTTYDYIATINNPSPVRTMDVKLDWGMQLEIAGANLFSAGLTSVLYQDNVAKAASSGYKTNPTANASNSTFGAGAGSGIYQIPSGTISTFKLTITKVASVQPDTAMKLRSLFLTAYGLGGM